MELEGQLKEKDQTKQAGRCCTGHGPSSHLQELTIQKLEEDATQLTGQARRLGPLQSMLRRRAIASLEVAELSGVRERAEQAEKMPAAPELSLLSAVGGHVVCFPRLEPWKKRTEEVHEAFQKEMQCV